jgi:hypothetical protein
MLQRNEMPHTTQHTNAESESSSPWARFVASADLVVRTADQLASVADLPPRDPLTGGTRSPFNVSAQ